ncbi:predicted protein [Plenodomus lingam JN3]|uniref:Uncharacterized protein n=1 Tax=Leptosphaeria maculans (strain JN3 / isolate v23.1.3 / race Av1-4-5-6-7-8) TaxID=985895 RepID=E5A6V7_LEPMJ|nr:predicted protein [Plenodomus lingam JN3]CBX99352.1 predicted protein [Plenodomus lingam JN3]
MTPSSHPSSTTPLPPATVSPGTQRSGNPSPWTRRRATLSVRTTSTRCCRCGSRPRTAIIWRMRVWALWRLCRQRGDVLLPQCGRRG